MQPQQQQKTQPVFSPGKDKFCIQYRYTKQTAVLFLTDLLTEKQNKNDATFNRWPMYITKRFDAKNDVLYCTLLFGFTNHRFRLRCCKG